MNVTELLQEVQFVVDPNGQRQAVQLDLAIWEQIVKLINKIDALEQEWREPFKSVYKAWETSLPVEVDVDLLDGESLVTLVHQERDAI